MTAAREWERAKEERERRRKEREREREREGPRATNDSQGNTCTRE